MVEMREVNIFLSYAHADDQTPRGMGDGWVTVFRSVLETMLKQRYRDKKNPLRFNVWMDKGMSPNQRFQERIDGQLRTVDAFVAVLSSDYLKSYWCGQEGVTFLAALMGRFPMPDEAAAREGIFLVDCEDVWGPIEDERSPAWGTEPDNNDTIRFVRDLKQQLAGAYEFWLKPANGTATRICEPVYMETHREADQFYRMMKRLVDDLIAHLVAKAPVQERRTRVLLVPPRRNTGSCWKEFEKIRDELTRTPSLELLPIFPQKPDVGIADAKKLEGGTYLELRAAVLRPALPEADILIQVLKPIVVDWDDDVVGFWVEGGKAIANGKLKLQMQIAEADKSEIIPTVESAASVTDKESAKGMIDRVFKYNSCEDVPALVVEQVRRLPEQDRGSAEQRANVVLVEACEDDLTVAEEVQNELSLNGLRFQNREYFQEGGILPSLGTVNFTCVMYVCEKGQRGELLERANAIAKFLSVQGGKLPRRGVIFYRPPQKLGFTAGSSFAFDKDFPVEQLSQPEVAGVGGVISQAARKAALRRSVDQFRAWIAASG
jgi:hypothetical protein